MNNFSDIFKNVDTNVSYTPQQMQEFFLRVKSQANNSNNLVEPNVHIGQIKPQLSSSTIPVSLLENDIYSETIKPEATKDNIKDIIKSIFSTNTYKIDKETLKELITNFNNINWGEISNLNEVVNHIFNDVYNNADITTENTKVINDETSIVPISNNTNELKNLNSFFDKNINQATNSNHNSINNVTESASKNIHIETKPIFPELPSKEVVKDNIISDTEKSNETSKIESISKSDKIWDNTIKTNEKIIKDITTLHNVDELNTKNIISLSHNNDNTEKEIIFRNKGGDVPGSGNTDTVPAMLTPGEFIVNKETTEKYRPFLEQINKGLSPANISVDRDPVSNILKLNEGGIVNNQQVSPISIVQNKEISKVVNETKTTEAIQNMGKSKSDQGTGAPEDRSGQSSTSKNTERPVDAGFDGIRDPAYLMRIVAWERITGGASRVNTI